MNLGHRFDGFDLRNRVRLGAVETPGNGDPVQSRHRHGLGNLIAKMSLLIRLGGLCFDERLELSDSWRYCFEFIRVDVHYPQNNPDKELAIETAHTQILDLHILIHPVFRAFAAVARFFHP